MIELPPINIHSEAEFLAHVIALKHESEERLQNMADCLSEHHNPEAAEVFANLAQLVGQTVQQLEAKAAGLQLPEIPPWEFQWHCKNDPESLCMDHAHYLMSARESLQLALFNEQRSAEFLDRVVNEVEHAGVRQLAEQQAHIERQFAEMIQQRLDKMAEDVERIEDLDPPNIPE
jgi:predicted RecB family nuclease